MGRRGRGPRRRRRRRRRLGADAARAAVGLGVAIEAVPDDQEIADIFERQLAILVRQRDSAQGLRSMIYNLSVAAFNPRQGGGDVMDDVWAQKHRAMRWALPVGGGSLPAPGASAVAAPRPCRRRLRADAAQRPASAMRRVIVAVPEDEVDEV